MIFWVGSKPTWVRLIYSMEQKQWRIGDSKVKDYRIKTDMLRSISEQSGESVSQSGRRKGRLWWEGFAEQESFEPGVEEWRGNGWWEWWVDGTNGGSATHRTGWGRIGEISAWLTEGSRELIPETKNCFVIFWLLVSLWQQFFWDTDGLLAYDRLSASWKDNYWPVLCRTNIQVTRCHQAETVTKVVT